MALILPWNGIMPRIAADAFIAPNATIIGDVEIGSRASIWFGCIVRGDTSYIRIGAGTNIQDGSIVHVSSANGPRKEKPTIIGANVLIGHQVMVHGATIEDHAFIGMSCLLLDACVVETDAMLGAGSLLSANKRIPRGQIWAGRPAKYFCDLTPDQITRMREDTEGYAERGQQYLRQLS